MAVQTQIQTRRGTAATWTSTNPTLAAGEIGFESDTGKFKIGTGSTAWNSLAYSAGATAVTYLYNATSGQTTFSGTDANGLTLAYTVGAEQVFLNGVLQVRGTDYTASNGTSVVLASGALTSDVLNIIAYSALTITDTYTQAQADAKFFQNANAFVAGKNKIINGDFGVWQRGTSFSNPTALDYNADRFAFYFDGTGATRTISRQTFTPGTAPVAGYEGQYFFRYAQTVAGTGNTVNLFYQKIENVQTFAGQSVILSFWAKADSARSITCTANQNFGTSGSADVDTNFTGTASVTTSWQRFSFTVAVPSISGKTIGASSFLGIRLFLPAGTTPTIDIWGVQVEAGSVATAFQTATGTIQGELAACQRYYYKWVDGLGSGGVGASMGLGANYNATQMNLTCAFPVTMRTNPTLVATTGTAYYKFERNGAQDDFDVLTIFHAGVSQAMLYNATQISGTAGQAGSVSTQSASASVAFSAEL
jgi:hypothetical protein